LELLTAIDGAFHVFIAREIHPEEATDVDEPPRAWTKPEIATGIRALNMCKSGLKDSIEAHLTIVFTALAIARDLQARSGWSLKKIVRGLRPLQQVTIQLGGQRLDAEPAIPDDIAELLTALHRGH
jgi:hypothetical protein